MFRKVNCCAFARRDFFGRGTFSYFEISGTLPLLCSLGEGREERVSEILF